jgi:hypothetical protein
MKDRLCDMVPSGHLLAAMGPAALLQTACDELHALRLTVSAWAACAPIWIWMSMRLSRHFTMLLRRGSGTGTRRANCRAALPVLRR